MKKPSAVSLCKENFCTFWPWYATWEIWSDFITRFAIAISNSVDQEHWEERENTYETIRRRYTDEEMSIITDLITDVITALGVNPDQVISVRHTWNWS